MISWIKSSNTGKQQSGKEEEHLSFSRPSRATIGVWRCSPSTRRRGLWSLVTDSYFEL